MKYKVISTFTDKDTLKTHKAGTSYSNEDADRIAFLQEKGFLEKSESDSTDKGDVQYPKHSGGAWYELSNGEKVQGKEEAAAAQEELDKEGE